MINDSFVSLEWYEKEYPRLLAAYLALKEGREPERGPKFRTGPYDYEFSGPDQNAVVLDMKDCVRLEDVAKQTLDFMLNSPEFKALGKPPETGENK